MAVLAYQGAALDSDTWKIEYQSTPTFDFTQGNSNEEIKLIYKVGPGKLPIVTLYDGNCDDLAAGGSPTALTVGGPSDVVVDTDITTDYTAASPPGTPLDTRTLKINIDKTLIDGSIIWDTVTSKIQFCVELTLVEGSDVITQE